MPPAPIMRFFEYGHLPPKLQEVSKPIGDVARQMDETLPDGPEKSTGLRKLLEAKDAFVRAALVLLVAVVALPACKSAPGFSFKGGGLDVTYEPLAPVEEAVGVVRGVVSPEPLAPAAANTK